MKIKAIAVLLILSATAVLLLPCVAGAEIVGRTADGYIHRYVADNGQEIYFVSNTEEALVETDVDVNFDGHPDLAVVTAMGASNAFYEFYLWNGSEYVYAERQTDDIVNYELVDGKYLVSRSNDGSAGLLFHTQICVWEENTLKSIRTMVSEEEITFDWSESTIIQITNMDRLHVTLWGVNSLAGEADKLWEKTYSPMPEDIAFFEEIETQLWNGIR